MIRSTFYLIPSRSLFSVSQKLCAVVLFVSIFWAAALHPGLAHANTLSKAVQSYVGTPLVEVGSSTFRKYGFRVYQATLWAPNGTWNSSQPGALQLHYQRNISKDTLAESLVDDLNAQHIADEETLEKWAKWIDKTLPSVKEGDIMVGVRKPGASAVLFLNGKKLATIHDPILEQAFFNIWLGDQADEDMRTALLNTNKK